MTTKLNTIAVVAKKELKDHLRDKRTTLLVVLLSILLGPLMLLGMGYFISTVEKKFESREMMVLGQEYAPELVNFLLRQDMNIKSPSADFGN